MHFALRQNLLAEIYNIHFKNPVISLDLVPERAVCVLNLSLLTR